ncbi:MAG: hypothetical protein K0V04_11180, partial [Deltaproteobacteria bacterium]|nr:hypothetical protein [Deltaproteobacteria bacterium]
MALGVILHATRTAFLAHAGPWLRRHEQRCSLLLGVVEPSSPQTPLPILASVVDDEQIVAEAVAVAGRKLMTSHGPPAAKEALCHRLRER